MYATYGSNVDLQAQTILARLQLVCSAITLQMPEIACRQASIALMDSNAWFQWGKSGHASITGLA